MHGEVRDIELRHDLLGGARVVVRRTADERESGERHDGIDRDATALEEELLDRRPGVEPGGERGDDAEAARFERAARCRGRLGLLKTKIGKGRAREGEVTA
jgi:hypothetical protein